MNAPLTPEQLEALRRLDACTLANAIETFHERLRNEGFVDHTVRCLFPRLQPMVGYAATIKIRGSAPPTADGLYPDRTDWWDYIHSLPAPRVVVVQDVATRPGLGLAGRRGAHEHPAGAALRGRRHQWFGARHSRRRERWLSLVCRQRFGFPCLRSHRGDRQAGRRSAG